MALDDHILTTSLFPHDHTLRLLLYHDVVNTAEVRAALLEGTGPEFALVNPAMVVSSFHLLLAATTALLHATQGTLSVKTLHAELLYCLAPTTNISESFRVFGAGPTDTTLLLAFVDTPLDDVRQVAALVKGTALAQDAVLPFLDARPLTAERVARFRKVFKLGVEEGGGHKKGGKKKKEQEEEGEGSEPVPPPPPSGRDEAEELEHTIISRIAAKRLL